MKEIKTNKTKNKAVRNEHFGGVALQLLCGLLLFFIAIPLFLSLWKII